MELLFESRTNIMSHSGALRFFQRPPYIHPEAVLSPDAPGDRKGLSSYGSVLHEGGKFRMWYYAVPETSADSDDNSCVAYAESDDGITWRKPALNILADAPAGSNLTNFGLHSGTLFIDPDSPASHRYRGIGCGHARYAGNCHGVKRRGFYTLHSADGLYWELDSDQPRWLSSDVITGVYHPGRRCAVIAMKYTPMWMRLLRRSIHTAEFRGGVYSDDVKALYPDEFDDVCASTRGFHSCDYYGMGMLPAGQGTLGFLWKYWHALPYTGEAGSQRALYGSSDIALVYQNRCGDCWQHFPGRPIFIDRNALPWTNGWIYSASNVVEVGDEQRLYFSGRSCPHGFGMDQNWQLTPEAKRTAKDGGITFASWPKWRLFGYEAMPEGSLIIHFGKVETPCELFLNYEIFHPEGSIRAELVGDGFDERTAADSVVLTGSQLAGPVTWTSGGAVIPVSAAARVRLYLRYARVYAYELRPVPRPA